MNKPTYTVRMERTVITLVTCEDCTEEDARANPWDYAVHEQDIDQVDWKVLKVTEDKP